MSSEEKQYRIFLKYTREYLSEVTGYSRGYLSKIASGSRPPGESFVSLCSYKLGEPAEELFRLKPYGERIAPAPPKNPLLETIDELASRLTTVEAEVKALQHELKQYG